MSIYFLLLCLSVAVVFAVMVMKVYYTLRLCALPNHPRKAMFADERVATEM
jgi:hypothetical protein